MNSSYHFRYNSTPLVVNVPSRHQLSGQDSISSEAAIQGDDDDDVTSQVLDEDLAQNLLSELSQVAYLDSFVSESSAAANAAAAAAYFDYDPADHGDDDELAALTRASKQGIYQANAEHEFFNMDSWNLISNVFKLQKTFCAAHPEVCVVPFGPDTQVADRFCNKLTEFAKEGKDVDISIAFHYTRSSNLESIRQGGLTSTASGFGRDRRIGYFGPGIYTSNNPWVFENRYGETCLIVAIVKGTTKRIEKRGMLAADGTLQLDCGIGSKIEGNLYYEETVLKTMEQVLPLLSFPSGHHSPGMASGHGLWDFCDELLSLLQSSLKHYGTSGRQPKTMRVDSWFV